MGAEKTMAYSHQARESTPEEIVLAWPDPATGVTETQYRSAHNQVVRNCERRVRFDGLEPWDTVPLAHDVWEILDREWQLDRNRLFEPHPEPTDGQLIHGGRPELRPIPAKKPDLLVPERDALGILRSEFWTDTMVKDATDEFASCYHAAEGDSSYYVDSRERAILRGQPRNDPHEPARPSPMFLRGPVVVELADARRNKTVAKVVDSWVLVFLDYFPDLNEFLAYLPDGSELEYVHLPDDSIPVPLLLAVGNALLGDEDRVLIKENKTGLTQLHRRYWEHLMPGMDWEKMIIGELASRVDGHSASMSDTRHRF